MTHIAAAAEKQGSALNNKEVETANKLEGSQVLISAKAIAVNPIDWKKIDWGLFVSSWPAIVGEEVSGVIEDVGPGQETFKKGDRVAAFGNGVYQQKVIIDQKRVFKIPSSLSFEDAATIPTGVITAGVALFHDLKLPLPDPSTPTSHPDPVLVWGGASSVGQFAIQLLKLAGYAKIFTTASSHNHDLVRSLGATEVLDYKNAEVVSEIIKANGGRKFKTVFDPVATEGSQVAVAGLVDENEGKVAVTLPKTAKFPSGAEVVSTFAYVIFFPEQAPLAQKFFALVEANLSEGLLRPNPVHLIDGTGDLAHGLNEGLKAQKAISGKKVVVKVA